MKSTSIRLMERNVLVLKMVVGLLKWESLDGLRTRTLVERSKSRASKQTGVDN
jgi:hypothetical protein